MSHEGHHGSSEAKMSQTFFGSKLQLISDSALKMALSENELYGGWGFATPHDARYTASKASYRVSVYLFRHHRTIV